MCGHFSPPDDEHRRARAPVRPLPGGLPARRRPAHQAVRVLRDRQPDAPPVLPEDFDQHP